MSGTNPFRRETTLQGASANASGATDIERVEARFPAIDTGKLH